MVVAESKPIGEILEMIKDCKKVLVAGCKGCVTVCNSGGEKEVGILASELRIARKTSGNDLEVLEYTCERQCDPEYIEPLDDLVKEVDAVVSIACSVGPQYIAARYPYLPVYPGLNTVFIGGSVEHGVFKEYCQACGSCIIGDFGGLCPVARCAKQLMNGPCGGSSGGKCEVGRGEIDCVWHLIYERLKNLGQLHKLEEPWGYKNWATSREAGPRTMIREELRK
ncbi:MAG: methylenetetrahydrofolate reductase C-terminal domain-containing protein [Deltaproteobacteria bacterium]|nr:methylenetetrahydrofolate reductase C-terminal domain-containing protein [Deltaproteobacteria bacterium]